MCGYPASASPRVAALHRPAAVAGSAERMSVRPPWGRTYICVALRPRVRCAHPRLQNSSAPLGPSSLSPFRCKIAGATPSPSPFRCKIAGATSSPPSSPQHAAVVPRSSCLCRCNASRDAAGPAIIPAACRGGTAVPIPHLYRHPAKLSAPQGSHYSITAGERSEPAESGPHHHRPQGGRTPYVRVLRRHPFGWQLSTACCRGWLCRAYARSTPLGPYIYMYGSSSAGERSEPAEGRTSLSCHLA